MIFVALIGGALGLVASLALRRNTRGARSLRGPETFLDDRFVFLSLPSFSLLLLGFGALGLAVPLIGGGALLTVAAVGLTVLASVMILVGAVGSAWGLLGKDTPPVVLPKWLRQGR